MLLDLSSLDGELPTSVVAVDLGLLNRHPQPWYTEPARPLYADGKPRRRVVLDDAEILALARAAGLRIEYVVALLAANEEERIWE